jgi:hypothetical protein
LSRFDWAKPMETGMIVSRLSLTSRRVHFCIWVDRFSCTTWGTGAGTAEAHAANTVRVAKTETFMMKRGDLLWNEEMNFKMQQEMI